MIEPPGLRTRGTGAVRATLGLVVQDGDFGQRDGGVTLGDAAVANELNPRDNVFNSSLTQGGANRALPLADAEPLDGLDPEIAVTFGGTSTASTRSACWRTTRRARRSPSSRAPTGTSPA